MSTPAIVRLVEKHGREVATIAALVALAAKHFRAGATEDVFTEQLLSEWRDALAYRREPVAPNGRDKELCLDADKARVPALVLALMEHEPDTLATLAAGLSVGAGDSIEAFEFAVRFAYVFVSRGFRRVSEVDHGRR